MRRLVILIWLLPGLALAHGGEASPGFGWALEPWAAVPFVLSAVLYGVGYARLRTRAGAGRARLDRQAILFVAGMLVLAAAVLSPLHQAGERSFTAHMAEHELMMLAAAPLLVWSRPLPAMIWAFPGAARQGMGGLVRSAPMQGLWTALVDPWVSTALQAAALWLWHLPLLFDLALSGEAWHAAQHLSFFVTALMFWTAMLSPRRNPWISALCLFTTSMISGALGAFMALSESPWYARYAELGMTPFGLTPSADQQLAGVLMWVPGGMVHAVAAIALLTPQLYARRAADA